MKKVNVYNYFDTSDTVIAKIIPYTDEQGYKCITEKTYKRLLKARIIGGIADVYTKAPYPIHVMKYNKYYGWIEVNMI